MIVQDIALIRAAGYEIISTNRGYILNQPKTVCRIFKVQHTDEQLEEELNTIVDLGGCVDNVMIHHRVYGKMEAELVLNSRRKVMASVGVCTRPQESWALYLQVNARVALIPTSQSASARLLAA